MRRLAIMAGVMGALAGTPSARGEEDMVYIAAGEFVMGTSPEEATRLAGEFKVHPSLFAGETPQRKAYVKAFTMDRYPVTNAEYRQFIVATKRRPPAHWKGGEFPPGQADYPVTNVSWADADAYAKWAGKRLPTEEEWEKAARGPEGLRYPWGNEWNDEACRPDDGASPQTPQPFPVGCFPKGASPYGVMEMAGNVAQWTATMTPPPYPGPGQAWYVVKGAGAAHHMRFNFRCAAKDFSAHTSRVHSWLGFRCAKDAPGEPPPPAGPMAPRVRALPAPVRAPGPDAGRYGKGPITLRVADGGHGAAFIVPCFPDAPFGLNVPEQAGVSGFPFNWQAGHTPIRWDVNEARTQASYQCGFEGKAELTVTLKTGNDFVDFTIAIRNLTDKPFTRAWSNTCSNNHNAPYFEDPERDRTLVWTDDGPVRLLEMPISRGGEPLHGGWLVAKAEQGAPRGGKLVRFPVVAVVSRDHQWIVAQACGAGDGVGSNAHYTCLHSRPVWPDIPPGEERSVAQKVYFLKGGPDDLLARWKKDFQR